MTEFIKSGLIILSLLIVPGIIMQVHAQYDIPDIPSQEDIEKMMQQNEVSGTYTNTEHGVSVVLPDGWSGMASDFQDPNTGEWISGFQAMKGGLAANMDAMQQGEYSVIMLSIIDQPEDKNPPEPKSPTDEYDFDCSEMTAEKIKANDKDVMKMQGECSGEDITIKTRAYHYATLDKIVMFAYATSPSSDFENHIDEFEDSVKTLSVDNQADVDYVIPDEMMAGSSEADDAMEETNDAMEEADDAMEEADDAMEETNDAMEEADDAMEETNDAMEETNDAMEETNDAMEETNDAMEEADDAMEEADDAMGIPMVAMSPYKQMDAGIAVNNVVCNEGKELLIKSTNGAASCVNSSSVSKLVERGWGSLP